MDTACYWLTAGRRTIDHNSLPVSIQSILYLLSSSSIKSMSLQFGDKDIMWDHTEGLTELYADDICQSSCADCCCYVIECHRTGGAKFALSKTIRQLWITSLPFMCLSKSSGRICFRVFPGTGMRFLVCSTRDRHFKNGRDVSLPLHENTT